MVPYFKVELQIGERSKQLGLKNIQIDSLLKRLRLENGDYDFDISNLNFMVDAMPRGNQVSISIKGAALNDLSQFQTGAFKCSSRFLTTFCLIEFYDFGTEVSPLGLGSKPRYNHSFM